MFDTECGRVSDLVAQPKVDTVQLGWQGGRHPPYGLINYRLRWKQLKIADCVNTEEEWSTAVRIDAARNRYTFLLQM